MLFAQKSNRVQPISDAEVQKFLNLGYDITDESGKIVHEAVPSGELALKSAFVRHTREIASLTAKNIKLMEDNTTLMAQIAQLTGQLDEIKSAESSATVAKKTRVSKKSATEPSVVTE